MIAEIGIIIGFYVITQMVDLVSRPKERASSVIAITAALFTILVTGLLTASLVIRGFSGLQ